VARRTIAREARLYRRDTHRGQAIGRIKVPRLGLNMILVNGTDHGSLTKGPGRDLRTWMPGQGELIYIAGHRTTYLAPFAHIEKLAPGDFVILEVPYATFRYRVFKHRIVDAHDLSVLVTHHREIVELQACHPRFFASQRYIAYGRLVRIEPRGGPAFTLPANALAAPPGSATRR
jgi:sortase A